MTIGSQLKEARKKKNLSQEEVSKKLLISRQSISKWENNICLPDLENFQKICELYDVDADEVLKEKILLDEKESTEEENIDKREMNMIYFILPFYWVYFLQKRLYKDGITKKIAIFIILNIAISVFILYFAYCEIPKNTYIDAI